MKKIINGPASAAAGPALLLLSAVMLSACSQDYDVTERQYTPAAHYERYPINVTKAPVSVGVAAKAGMLSPEQINRVKNFADDARHNAQSKISIRWPAGSGKSRQVAQDIARIFAEEGVPKGRIRLASYPGGASSPIQISYVRKVAVTRECGDWSENISYNPTNAPHPNYGCAIQQNIAAMVASPEDFERPRAMSPITAANRTAAMDIYYSGVPAPSGRGLLGFGG